MFTTMAGVQEWDQVRWILILKTVNELEAVLASIPGSLAFDRFAVSYSRILMA